MDAPETGVDALTLRRITKRYGATTALDGVDFSLRPCEIHGVLGENGAGKSTLLQIVGGMTAPDSGTIAVHGQPTRLQSADDARRASIGMVHQHFQLVPAFTALDNLVLATGMGAGALRGARETVAAQAASVASRLGWDLPFGCRVDDLAVGVRQRLEIVKALLSCPSTSAGQGGILLFDEPTAVLAPAEIEDLLRVMRSLRDDGRAVVFVSHKLREVMAVCDRVTVLRLGKVAGTVAIGETDPEDLASRMVGRGAESAARQVFVQEAAVRETADAVTAAPSLLWIKDLSTARSESAVGLSDISFEICPGEILGVAGVDGNGQTELVQVLAGVCRRLSGSIAVAGRSIGRLTPSMRARLGIAVIPPDRQREGLALDLSVGDNLIAEAVRRREYRRGPILRRRALAVFARECVQRYDIRSGSIRLPARALSGGNQQKIVIARALSQKPLVIVAASPTRGLDVGATAYVHARLREARAAGAAILLVSTELDEIIALSDRIAVMHSGRVAGIVPPNTPREKIGLLMAGTDV